MDTMDDTAAWPSDVVDCGGDLDRAERAWRRERERARREREAREREDRLDRLPFTLREAARAVDDAVEHGVRRQGVTDLPLLALHVLVLAKSAQPVVNLAHRLRVSPQRASQLVGLLERHGLVDKTSSGTDKRVRIVEATDAGHQVLERLRAHLEVVLGVVADDVGAERLADFQGQLERVAMVEPEPGPWSRW